MTDQAIEKGQWNAFCDSLSRRLEGAQAEIEIAALGLGDQTQAQWLPLLGVTYDPKDDIFEIAVEGLDHIIHNPTSLAVRREGARVASLAIMTAAGDRHIVQFREPLHLPAPEAAGS